MLMHKKISVIVPIYNREKYLSQALDSLLGQTHRNLDIILVDDGSTDSSLDICRQYATRDERIRVIHQDNQGSATARNVGIEAAEGDYLIFLESDDWLDLTMYETMLRRAESVRADIVKANYWSVVDEKGTCLPNKRWDAIAETWGDRAFSLKEEPRIADTHASIWASLYRTDFIKNNTIRFIATPKATYSDRSWMAHTLAAAQRISVINEYLYFYRKIVGHDQSGNRKDELCFYMPYHCMEARKIYKKFDVHEYIVEQDYLHSFHCCMTYFKKIREDLRNQYFELFHEVMKDAIHDGLQYTNFNNKKKRIAQAIIAHDKDTVLRLMKSKPAGIIKTNIRKRLKFVYVLFAKFSKKAMNFKRYLMPGPERQCVPAAEPCSPVRQEDA